jgi:hypothetical protein
VELKDCKIAVTLKWFRCEEANHMRFESQKYLPTADALKNRIIFQIQSKAGCGAVARFDVL